MASTDVTGRVQEHKTQEATELHGSVLCPVMAPGTHFLTSQPSSPTKPKSEYLNLTFHGVEAQKLPISQLITSHHEPPELITLIASEGQRGHPPSDLVLAALPLLLEVQSIIAIIQRLQLRSRTVAKHCIAGSLGFLWALGGRLHHRCH